MSATAVLCYLFAGLGAPPEAEGWWSLQPVVDPQPPPIIRSDWPRNALDAFVLAQLEARGIEPAPQADRRTLVRRLTLDLLGLPPTPEQVERFVTDRLPGAYERLVDELLASPHYGERWSRHWLDVVRFTESDGYEHDKFRPHAWRYRDYVVSSLNDDKPYDHFVREQLAGDTLEPATSEGIVASGFLVAGPWDEIQNVGSSKSEMARAREEQVAEMIETICQTFLATTVACARCHDHKFDPIPQADYYRVKAAFDGVDHSRGSTRGNHPILTAPQEKERQATLGPLKDRRSRIDEELRQIGAQLPADAVLRRNADDALAEGRFGQALDARRTIATVASREAYHELPLTVDCWARTESSSGFNVFVANNRKESGEHWELYSFSGRGDFSVFLPGYEPATIRSGVVITDGRWHHLGMQLEHEHVRLFVDGRQVRESALQRRQPDGAIGELCFGGYAAGGIGCDGLVDEVRITRGLLPLTSLPERAPGLTEATLGLWSFNRVEDNLLRDAVRPPQEGVPMLLARRARLQRELENVEREVQKHKPPLGYVGFRRQPPATHVLERGDVRRPGERVGAGALTAIEQLPASFVLDDDADEGERRAHFAVWTTREDNPLTARVLVNRVWAYHFGKGLVDTPSDFGRQGSFPSHPLLLDWLSSALIRDAWSIKRLHRRIVCSATYQQSSRFNRHAARTDADNRSLWRFTPRRLEAETVRDAMLATSGVLNRAIGGPSYQPFTIKVFNTHFYELFDSERREFQRRTLYRANVITGRSPLLDALDCPSPGVTAPTRFTSTTPLQALSLMNDPFVVRQARAFAARLEAIADRPDEQAIRAYRLALGRSPTTAERAGAELLVREHGTETLTWALFNMSEFLYLK